MRIGCRRSPLKATTRLIDGEASVQRLDNERKAVGPIVAVAREKPHTCGTASRQKPEAVVFYIGAANPALSAAARPGSAGGKARRSLGRYAHAPTSCFNAARNRWSRVGRGGRQMRTRYGPSKSRVEKRSVVIAGHRTSVCLEDPFWMAVKEIAAGREMTVSDLVAVIDSQRHHGNLSSAIRLFVLDFYRNQCSKPGRDGAARNAVEKMNAAE